jgi:hypothetical protein
MLPFCLLGRNALLVLGEAGDAMYAHLGSSIVVIECFSGEIPITLSPFEDEIAHDKFDL